MLLGASVKHPLRVASVAHVRPCDVARTGSGRDVVHLVGLTAFCRDVLLAGVLLVEVVHRQGCCSISWWRRGVACTTLLTTVGGGTLCKRSTYVLRAVAEVSGARLKLNGGALT